MRSLAALASLPALLSAGVIGPGVESDPRVWQSDIRVGSMAIDDTRPGAVTVRVTVSADGDDPARNSRLEVLLPIGVAIVRVADECRPSPSPVPGLNARVTCELGNLSAKSAREVSIATTSRVSGQPMRIAAFAFSDTPDPEPGNNFAERVAR